ncbi:hypothetical protein BJX63DRAFT_436286 [Aspergillus granulosus]|uniref:Uncharacterized protein n=1 Tax=Aspergillus granulosus TaxID=176169 RepID=A0ABR4GYM7_9EURO
MPSATKPSTTGTPIAQCTNPITDCTNPTTMCNQCRLLYQELLMAYGPCQLDLVPGYYPVIFTNTFPAKTKLKFLDTFGKSLESTLSFSYGMVNAKVWKIAIKNEDALMGNRKESTITLRVLIDFPHRIKILDDMLRGMFLQFPVPFTADEKSGATGWKMQLPGGCSKRDGELEHDVLARLRYWKEVDELLTAKRILNNDMRA